MGVRLVPVGGGRTPRRQDTGRCRFANRALRITYSQLWANNAPSNHHLLGRGSRAAYALASAADSAAVGSCRRVGVALPPKRAVAWPWHALAAAGRRGGHAGPSSVTRAQYSRGPCAPLEGEPADREVHAMSGDRTRACPFCREPINAQALKCKHCGSPVEPALPTPCPTTAESVPSARSPSTPRR